MVSKLAAAGYDSELELEHDVKTLARGGLDMTRVAVVGADRVPHNHVAFVHTGRRARFFGAHARLWNTLSELLLGAALAFGAGGEHLVIVGAPAFSVVPQRGGHEFLLVINGNAHDIERARELLPHVGLTILDPHHAFQP
jgi:hypothetical protein